jgi:drug/metabolite transporter (DMT)-like permease
LSLAELLYLGSGIGLTALRLAWRSRAERGSGLSRADVPWLGGAVVFGGVLGPVLLMAGLQTTPAATAALLLNLEGVFTVLLAWSVFRENFDRRIALGMALIVAALLVGLVGYGLSLAFFVLALRHLGTARTGAYFSLAPFMGAAVAVLFPGEPMTGPLLMAGSLMGAGAWLHLTERHEHDHAHEAVAHVHAHVHGEHHGHDHPAGTDEREPHVHEQVHQRLTHRHPHHPDTHHRHGR